MFDIMVSEAAERLGVTPGRVHQLIKNGSLAAEKAGGVWLVDSLDVSKRASTHPSPGRPTTRPSSTAAYTLMNREHEVLDFRFDADRGVFTDASAIKDPRRAPLGVVSTRGRKASGAALEYWWRHRCIPKNRAGIDAKLRELGISETYNIPFRSLGLSLSDQYWVKPKGADIAWADINFFHNAFDEMEADGWLSEVGLDSPDNTSDGVLPKAWVCRGRERVLLKGGGLNNQEPYNEAAATLLFSRVLQGGEYVPYELVERGSTVVSSCRCFVADDEEYIPAYYVLRAMKKPAHRDDFQHYIECCARFGVTDAKVALQKMIVCDDVLANRDRHWRNFGLIRNVETLECRVAPLFDSGSSLWSDVPTRDMAYTGHGFETKPFRSEPNDQLRLVDDFSWLDSDALTGFAEDAVDLLEKNPAMQGRLDFIYEGIQSRIDHLRTLLR